MGQTFGHRQLQIFPFDLVLSFCIIVMAHVEGIRRRGLNNTLKGFVTPAFYDTNESSGKKSRISFLLLCDFGNIFAGEVMDKLVSITFTSGYFWYPIAFGTNLVWTAFSVFISCVQAYVFTLLSSMYLGNKINDEE